MRAIVYVDGNVVVKRRASRRQFRVLEYCKNNEVPDKLAYWKYTCLPEFRANLTEHQNLVKFAFFNPKLGTTLYSVHDSKDKLKQIKNIEDYEPITFISES